MKKLLGIIVITLVSTLTFAIDRSTPSDATFSACGGKDYILKNSEIFATELAEVENLETYEQVLTYNCYTPHCGATSCLENCRKGFTQHYWNTDSPVELVYGVILRVYDGTLTMYTFEKNITVIVYPAPKLNFGADPLSR